MVVKIIEELGRTVEFVEEPSSDSEHFVQKFQR